MELDITNFFNNAAPMDYSASIAEIGQNAGADTWRAAKDDSTEYPLLTTDEQREAFRNYIKGVGAWDTDEIAAMDDTDLNALCIQVISRDMRKSALSADTDDAGWTEYERKAERGSISGRIYKGDDGKVYIYIGE